MQRYLGAATTSRVGAHLRLDNDYFNRMDALNYAIGHDDGQGGQDLDQADVVLLGVSRTSKTPTCIYLAHRGVRAANVPLVPGRPLPEKLATLKNALIVGLLISPPARSRSGATPAQPQERTATTTTRTRRVRDEIISRGPASTSATAGLTIDVTRRARSRRRRPRRC